MSQTVKQASVQLFFYLNYGAHSQKNQFLHRTSGASISHAADLKN